MTVRRFRKKPVEIEAVQFQGDVYVLVEAGWNYAPMSLDFEGQEPVMRIHTLGGLMTARRGDYIIRGIQGEFYPCKPDIFEATYDEADKPDLLGRLADEMLDHFEFEKYEQLGLQCQYCLWVPGREWDPIHDCVLKHLYDETKSKEVSE